MSKKISVFLVICVFVLSLLNFVLPDVNVLGDVSDSFSITLSSSSFKIYTLPSGEQKIKMDGFASFTTSGEPALPSKVFRILLPPLAKLKSIRIKSTEKVDLGYGHKIITAPFPTSQGPGNLDIKSGDEPVKLIENLGVKQQRKWTFLEVKFSPFEYTKSNGHLVLNKKVILLISYKKPAKVPDKLLRDAVLNGKSFYEFLNQSSANLLGYDKNASLAAETYLILTSNSIENSGVLNDFISFKQSFGYNVQVITVESSSIQNQSGRDLQEKVRNYLIGHYLSDNIKYVLIIGDIDTIPMRYCYPDPNDYSDDGEHKIPTDYYYADLTGNWDSDNDDFFGEYGQDNVDFNPEVYVGRIPFDDTTIINSILHRTISFEQNNDSWKKRALLLGAISNYQGEDNNPKTDGAVLMEKMWSDFLSGGGFQRTTMYEKGGLSPSSYSCNYPLTESNVVNHWANDGGYGIVGWDGHGNPTGTYRKIWSTDDGDNIPESNEMTWAKFISNSDAQNLDQSHPSIVFSCACNNSWPENSENLSKMLLKYTSVAVVGSTGVSWYIPGWSSPSYGGNSSIEYYFFQDISEDKSVGISLYEGKILANDNGEIYANMYDFNLYGDPSVELLSPLTITTTSLPNGTVGAAYSATLQASGGTGSYTWSITSGSLPNGLTLNASTGEISGTPTTANTYNFTVQVSDGTQTATKDLSITINAVKPSVTTNSASNITSSSATLNGTLTDMGGASSVTVYFQYGTDTNYGNETTHQTQSSTGTFSANLTNLSSNTTYHFRAVAVNSAGTAYGQDETFTTAQNITPPSPPQNLTATPGNAQVTLTWQPPSSNGGASITNYKIYRGTSSNNETYLTEVSGSTTTYTDTSVTNGTTYYYKVTAVNSAGESNPSNEASAILTIQDQYEPDNDPAHASLIPTDGTIQHHDFGTQGDVDWIKFNAEAGKTYTINTLNLGSNCNTMMTLYAPDGTTFIDFNDNYDSPASRIDFECPQGKGGTYYVKIRNYNSNKYGANTNYDVRVYPALKISLSDSDNGGKDFGIIGQDNHITVTVTQDGNPVQGASVYESFDGSTYTTDASGNVSFNVNSSYDRSVYISVNYSGYKRCYTYFYVLNSNESLVKVKPKDINGYYLANFSFETVKPNEISHSDWSSYHNTEELPIRAGDNDIVIVSKPDWVSNDIGYYMIKPVSTTSLSETTVPFDVSTDTVALSLTGELDNNPLTDAGVELKNNSFDYNAYLIQGYTNSSGKQTIYVTPGTYTAALIQDNRDGSTPDVVLMDTGINVSSNASHTISYTSSQLGTLNRHAYDGNNNEIEHYLEGFINNCYIWTYSTGEPMLLVPGTYQWDYEESNIYSSDWSNRWHYDFIPTETTNVTAGSSSTINFGGPLTCNITPDKSSYAPGDNVNIKVNVIDSYGHYLDYVYYYSSSSSSSGSSNPSIPNKNEHNEFIKHHKYNNPNLMVNEQSDHYVSPLTSALSSGWTYPRIHLTVTDPNANTVADESNYDFWYMRNNGYTFTLPSNAPSGTYTATASLSVGLYNNSGSVTGSKTFTVTNTSPLTITTTSLPNGTVGTSYSATLQATGGTGTYTWSITSGNLPDGLTLNASTGEITGTPTTANTYNFTVQVSDGTQTATKDLSITISTSGILGDVNGDGKIDSGDAILVLRYAAGLINLTPSQLACADVNKDGVVDSGDAILILRYAAGLINHF